MTNTWIMYEEVLWLWRAVSRSLFLACHSLTVSCGKAVLRLAATSGEANTSAICVSTALTRSVDRPSAELASSNPEKTERSLAA